MDVCIKCDSRAYQLWSPILLVLTSLKHYTTTYQNIHFATKMQWSVLHFLQLSTFETSITEMKHSGAGNRIFWENQVNTIATDALATCVPRSSTAMLLTVYNTQVMVFHSEGFQGPLQFQRPQMIENPNTIPCFLFLKNIWQIKC